MSIPDAPTPQDLAELFRAAGRPVPPPGLEDSMLQSLRAATVPPAWSASPGAQPPAAGPLRAALGKWGVATTVSALVAGAVGGVAVGRYSAAPPLPRVEAAPSSPAPAVRAADVMERPAPPPPVARPPPKRVEKPAAARDGAAEEQPLIEMARTALLRREPELAKAPLGEHERRFPSGQLAEERDALWVQVYATAGEREQAAERAAAFRRKYPKSLLGPTVDRALEAPR